MITDAFPQFWQTYPRKVGKKDALKAWSKLTPEQRLKAMEAIPTHVRYWQVCNTESTFIPHASSWLNGWRFEDEIEEPKPKPKKQEGSIAGARPGESWEDYLRRVAG